MYFIDNKTHNVKMGTNALFNEVHFTVDSKRVPIVAQVLQRMGYSHFDNKYKHGVFISDATL